MQSIGCFRKTILLIDSIREGSESTLKKMFAINVFEEVSHQVANELLNSP